MIPHWFFMISHGIFMIFTIFPWDFFLWFSTGPKQVTNLGLSRILSWPRSQDRIRILDFFVSCLGCRGRRCRGRCFSTLRQDVLCEFRRNIDQSNMFFDVWLFSLRDVLWIRASSVFHQFKKQQKNYTGGGSRGGGGHGGFFMIL